MSEPGEWLLFAAHADVYTAQMLAGFSKEAILHEVLIAPRAVLMPRFDTQIIERPGWWQIVTPSITDGGMNEVGCDELPGENCDEIITQTIALYRQLGLQFRWMLGPRTKPTDLAERLARLGLQRSESFAMACATAEATAERSPAITTESVSLANVDDFTQLMAEGWQTSAAPLDDLHRKMLRDPAGRYQLMVARHDGRLGAAAGYIALARSAYLVGAVTLPSSRGLGLYRALVYARLRHAQERGLVLATTIARAETSAPILTRLGFKTVCAVPVFQLRMDSESVRSGAEVTV